LHVGKWESHHIRKMAWKASTCGLRWLCLVVISKTRDVCFTGSLVKQKMTMAVLRKTCTHTHPPHPQKMFNRLLYCILKIGRLLYWVFKKACQKACRQKGGKKVYSWTCLETGLKPTNNPRRGLFDPIFPILLKIICWPYNYNYVSLKWTLQGQKTDVLRLKTNI